MTIECTECAGTGETNEFIMMKKEYDDSDSHMHFRYSQETEKITYANMKEYQIDYMGKEAAIRIRDLLNEYIKNHDSVK